MSAPVRAKKPPSARMERVTGDLGRCLPLGRTPAHAHQKGRRQDAAQAEPGAVPPAHTLLVTLKAHAAIVPSAGTRLLPGAKPPVL